MRMQPCSAPCGAHRPRETITLDCPTSVYAPAKSVADPAVPAVAATCRLVQTRQERQASYCSALVPLDTSIHYHYFYSFRHEGNGLRRGGGCGGQVRRIERRFPHTHGSLRP